MTIDGSGNQSGVVTATTLAAGGLCEASRGQKQVRSLPTAELKWWEPRPSGHSHSALAQNPGIPVLSVAQDVSSEGPAPTPWPLPSPGTHSYFKAKLWSSLGAAATSLSVHVLGAVLTY